MPDCIIPTPIAAAPPPRTRPQARQRNGANPRFVVTSLARSRYAARALYEDLYCARGEAENRIGEQFERCCWF
jgi:hypothetical protein